MSGIGDDAASTIMRGGSDFFKLLLELARICERNMINKGNNNHTKKESKKPKLKHGSIKHKDLQNYQKETGIELQYLNIDTNKVDQLSELAKKYGVSFSEVTVNGSNLSTIAFPNKDTAAIDHIIKTMVQEKITNDPNSYILNNDKLMKDDFAIANSVFTNHDIPVYMFNIDNGNIMTAVPKEYSEQFEAGLSEINKLKKEFKNIEIINFESFGDISDMKQTVTELTLTEAQALNEALMQYDNNLGVQFTYDKNNTINIIYPTENKDKIENLRNDFLASKEFTENYKISVVGNEVQLDKKSLLIHENDKEFFMKIPNTKGEQYINLDKLSFSDNGQSVTGKFDLSKNYTILDKNGDFLKEVSGKELSQNFERNSIYAKNNPNVIYSDTNSVQRIELFNAKTNQLMKIGLDDSDSISKILIANGFDKKSAQIMVAEINKQLNAEQKDIFNYNVTDNQIPYVDIQNIDELKNTSIIAQKLATADAVCVGTDNGLSNSKVCVFDKNTNEYCILPVTSMDKLSDIVSDNFKNYSQAKCDVIVKAASHGTIDTTEYDRLIENTKSFDTKNAVLQNVSYGELDNSVFLVNNINDSYKFIEIPKDLPRFEIESAISNQLGINEAASIAELMNYLDKEKLIEPPMIAKGKDYSLEMLSSQYCNVKFGEQTVMLDKKNITPDSIFNSFENMDSKLSEKLSKNINATLDKVEHGKTGTLSNIMNIAHNLKQTMDSNGTRTDRAERTQEGR